MSSPAPNSSDLERYRRLLPADEAAALERAVGRPLLPALRVNTLKTAVEEAARWADRYGWQVRPVPFCPAGWQIAAGDRAPGGTPEHRFGLYYVQEAASMLPAELFRLDAGARPLVLDVAASPGGKTTHLVARSGDRGLVLANDASARRIPALRANLQDWGATCTAVTNYDGGLFGGWFPETFDAALVDAPCSGHGLREAGRRRARDVSPGERERLHARQVRLLAGALAAVRTGGQVVYATCTLAPEENEAVLDALLALYPRQAEIEAPPLALPVPAPGLAGDGERRFHPDVRRALRLWPHLYDTAGFFAALIRKQGPVEPAAGGQPAPPSRPLAEAGFHPPGPEEKARLYGPLLDGQGFDLGRLVEELDLVLLARGESVRAVPAPFLSRFAGLPVVEAGMALGEWAGEDFVVSHELAARIHARFAGERLVLAEEQAAGWLSGRDLRGMDAGRFPHGAVVLVEDGEGRFMGRARMLGGRVRNLLPRRLVV